MIKTIIHITALLFAFLCTFFISTQAMALTISGTCKQANNITDCTDTGTIRFATHAGGGTLRPEKQEIVAGTWTISGIPPQALGLIMTVFIEGAPDHQEAVAVFNYDGSTDVTGVELIETHLSIGADSTRGISNFDLRTYDNSVSGNEDIFHDVDNAVSRILTVDITRDVPTPTLYLKENYNYAPGGNINTHHLETKGTLGLGSNTVNVSGDWKMTIGIFNRDTSTVNFTGTGTIINDVSNWWNKSFYNLSMSASGQTTTIPSNRGIVAKSLVTLGTGTMSGGTLILEKSTTPLINNGATFVNGTLKFSPPSSTPQLDIPAGNYPNIWLASYGTNTTFTLLGDINCINLSIRGNRSNRRSTLDANSKNITCTNMYIGRPNTSQNGSLISNGSTITLTQDLINFLGLSAPNHNVIDAGTASANFNIGRSWSNRDIFIAGNSTVTFNGDNDQAILTGGDPFYNVTIDNTVGANNNIFLGDDLNVNNNLVINTGKLDTTSNNYNITVLGNLDQSSTTGKLEANTSTLTVHGNFNADGTLDSTNYNNASLILPSTSNLTYNNLTQPWSNGFNNLTAGQTGNTTTLQSRFSVRNILTIGSGSITGDSHSIFLQGNNPLNLDPNSNISLYSLRFFRNGEQFIPPLNNGYNSHILISRDNTSVIQTGDITLNTGKSLFINGDGFPNRTVSYQTNGFNLSIGGNLQIGDGNDTALKILNISNSAVTVGQDFEILSGTNDLISTNSNIILNGSSAQSITMNGKSMNTLTLNNTSSAGVTFTDAFTANTVTNTTPNSTMTFAAGQNFTVNNAINLQGATGQLINLASSSLGSHWNFILNGGASKTIDHISVSWSDASGSHSTQIPIDPSNTARDSNTIDWFPQPHFTVTKNSILISDPINGTGGGRNRIPGAIIEYSLTTQNTGDYSPDNNTVIVLDVIDSDHVELDVTSGVAFTDGSTSSGVTLGVISYSHRSTPTSYTYTPTGTFDPNVAGIRIETNGTFAFGGVPNPEFTVTYRVRVK